MPKQIIGQTSFTAGELTPRLQSRTKTDEYQRGLEEATNVSITPHGTIKRRNGTKYIAEVKTSSDAVRLVRFQFSQTVAFILEFGNTYIRFYKDSGVVLDGGSPYEITSPYNAAQVQELQYRQSGSTIYIVHPDFAPRTLTRTADTNWAIATLELLPPPTYESGYTATGFTMTPAATTGVGVNFTSSSAIFLDGDIGRQIINLSSGEVGRASIISVTSATVAVCDIVENFTNTDAIASDDWYLDLSPVVDLEVDSLQAGSIANVRSESPSGALGTRVAITAITAANPGVVTATGHGLLDGDRINVTDVKGMTQLNGNVYTVKGKTTNTFSLADDVNADVNTTSYTAYTSGGIVRKRLTGIAVDAFRAADVGKYILINGGVMQVLTVNSATDIDCEILKNLNDKTSTGNWSLEVATWDATRGYPRAVGQYQQRLVFGGTAAQPQNVWMSEIGIFDGFGAGPDDEDALDIELVSDEVNEINWISASRDLVVGTSGGELTVSSGSSSSITPSTVQQQARTYHGSDTQQVAKVGEEILFIQNSGRKIRTFRYDFNLDGYTGEDLNFLAEHITEGGLKEVVYSQEPNRVVHAVTNDGDLLAGAYDRSKKLVAWSKYTTDGIYENIATIGKAEEDQVWVVVKREINGATVRNVELFVLGDGSDDLHAYQDSFLTLSTNKAITNITAASPAVVTSASHGFSNGDKVIIKDLVDPAIADTDAAAVYMSSLNNCTFTVASVATNTFELSGKDTSAYNAYGSSGNAWEKVTAISGLGHLEGKTVSIRADGAVLPNEVVTSGAITLDSAAGEVVVGLPYTTTIKTLGHEFDSGSGSMQGQRVRWAKPLLKVIKSTRPLLNGEFLPNRSTTDSMSKKVPLFTGFLEYGSLNWANSTALTITLTDPLPLEISGITGPIDSGVK